MYSLFESFQPDIDSTFWRWWSFFIIILTIILVFALMISQGKAFDCHSTSVRKCNHRVNPPDTTTPVPLAIDQIREMVRQSRDFVAWRQALLIGFIVVLPLIYLLFGRAPTLFEWLIVVGLVFLGMYFSLTWINIHFQNPTGQQIEKSLDLLVVRLNNGNTSI